MTYGVGDRVDVCFVARQWEPGTVRKVMVYEGQQCVHVRCDFGSGMTTRAHRCESYSRGIRSRINLARRLTRCLSRG